ncbi:uncharacterized protein HD556DRAFT_1312375 [Suillus plorans]|uniref:Uncharacterized protein n=1 Tax=Suillus plorans TaxID=116603 RepID=A0A9P7DD37_9AGAM|nr:uncharacterized protein HD556DRAFT_1312375 [Suillus plorans]KAG1787947.1 hypothetical protein HD556DRAFT_1312375 [Suillus plorans]
MTPEWRGCLTGWTGWCFSPRDPRLLCTAFSLREYYLVFKRTRSNRSTYRRMHRKWNRFQMGFKRGAKAGRHLLVLVNQIKRRRATNFFLFVVVTGCRLQWSMERIVA